MSRNEISALAAIKRYCIQCSAGSEAEVKRCSMKECPLYKFRFGATRDAKKGDK